ncbi:MAG TPA: hypothetical protein PKL09_03020 [bacterium]|nr:hypothetical protein [bacterium]HNS33977.1 hypothetical protein [bacterium]HNZ73184.1 hypothetical protein [bacterium]HOH66920.1 hypothetical protein [bacterium]HQA63499.1 hypothetical protein [bacterium]
MALNLNQQILESINRSRSILIIFRRQWTGDAVAASLALAQALKTLGKKTDLVCQDFQGRSTLSFLPLTEIKDQLKNIQKFVISVDTSQIKLGEFDYDRQEQQLNFYITPTEGKLSIEQVSASVADFKYDLIFIINSPDLESLGDAYRQHSDFFFATPKINLDHSHKNEHYGDINLVDLAASSSSEIVYRLIKNIDHRLISDDVATYLLAGIISATKNFKSANVNPTTLNLAGQLITEGARREQIIQNFYQTKFLSTLKIWGRILSRLKNDCQGRLVWSTISKQDFLDTSTGPEDITEVIDELIVNMPDTEIIALIYENIQLADKKISCLLFSVKKIDSRRLAARFNPDGSSDLVRFSVNAPSLIDAEREIIEEIKKSL